MTQWHVVWHVLVKSRVGLLPSVECLLSLSTSTRPRPSPSFSPQLHSDHHEPSCESQQVTSHSRIVSNHVESNPVIYHRGISTKNVLAFIPSSLEIRDNYDNDEILWASMEYYKFSSSFIIFHHLSVPPMEISKNDQVNAVNAAVQEANSSKEISP